MMSDKKLIHGLLIGAFVTVLIGYSAMPGTVETSGPEVPAGASLGDDGSSFDAYVGWLKAAHGRAAMGQDDTSLPSQF
jgi:hypothetical protein